MWGLKLAKGSDCIHEVTMEGVDYVFREKNGTGGAIGWAGKGVVDRMEVREQSDPWRASEEATSDA